MFKDRLEEAMRRGNLRTADLARWFGRAHTTVKGWLEGREPSGTPVELSNVNLSLAKLEIAIVRKQLPMPGYEPAKKRIAHLAKLRRSKRKS